MSIFLVANRHFLMLYFVSCEYFKSDTIGLVDARNLCVLFLSSPMLDLVQIGEESSRWILIQIPKTVFAMVVVLFYLLVIVFARGVEQSQRSHQA